MTENATVVVVGAGQAGGWAAATLRAEGFGGRVVLVGEEPHRPYERPPLSKAVLAGTAEPASTHLHTPEAFEAQSLDWRPGVRAESIDLRRKRVNLADGEHLEYDRLILATGGRAAPLAVPGAGLPGVHTLRTHADAAALGARLRVGGDVVVAGGGWIGLEVAATARAYGCTVTVLEMRSRLCERSVPPVISDYLLALHEAHGVRLRLGVRVTRIEANGNGVRSGLVVETSEGSALPADTVVAGVGLVPNDEIAREAGLLCDGGIVVDAGCRTSDPDVFAAGDVTVTPNRWAGRPVRLESWQNAQEQGVAAAKAALGVDVQHDILPWFWSDQYDVNLQIFGVPQPGHTEILRGDPASGSFVVGYLDGTTLAAAMGPDAARELRAARKVIERRIHVTAAQLADATTPLPRR